MRVDANFFELSHSEETVQRMSEAKRQNWEDPEVRERMLSAQNAGRAKMTPEQKDQFAANVSNGLKAAYASGERKSNKGQTRSEDFCARNSANIKDKWQDPEYRARQLASRQGKTNEKARVPIIGDDVEYESIQAAGAALGITPQSIKYRLNSDNYPGWKRK